MTIRIEDRTGSPPDSANAALARICEDFLPKALAASPRLADMAKGTDVHVVLSGDEEAGHWGVDGDAVGYFAVMSPRRIDEDGQWFDVNERFEVHLNMEVALPLLAEHGRDGVEQEIEAWLVTIPHELLHVADWIDTTGGLTPVEVFDSGKGDLAIGDVFGRMEAAARAAGEDIEDRIEETAREIAYAALLRNPLPREDVEIVVRKAEIPAGARAFS